MKLVYKIAILIGFTVAVSSCQKENIPSPGDCPSHQETQSNQRIGGSSDTSNAELPHLRGGGNEEGVDEIVGGGDDDRDGGGGKKEPKKGQ